MGINVNQLRDLMRGPNNDTRQWVSIGIVEPDTDGARSVVFDPELGPLVTVMLQPTMRQVVCRVGGSLAGDGEAEWHPLSAGDEVLVMLPQGSEASFPVITARLNNDIDAWPTNVAGQDPTQNTFGFLRRRTPFITETSAALLFRNATTGAQFGLDEQGQFILNDASGTRFFLTADASGLSTPDGSVAMQIVPEDKSVFLQGGAASFDLNGTETKFVSSGSISFTTSGLGALGHAVTLEQLVVILGNLLQLLAPMFTPLPAYIPIPPATPAIPITPPLIDDFLKQLLTLASTGAPINFLALPLTQAAILQGLAVPPDPLGIKPGIGKAGFLL